MLGEKRLTRIRVKKRTFQKLRLDENSEEANLIYTV